MPERTLGQSRERLPAHVCTCLSKQSKPYACVIRANMHCFESSAATRQVTCLAARWQLCLHAHAICCNQFVNIHKL